MQQTPHCWTLLPTNCIERKRDGQRSEVDCLIGAGHRRREDSDLGGWEAIVTERRIVDCQMPALKARLSHMGVLMERSKSITCAVREWPASDEVS